MKVSYSTFVFAAAVCALAAGTAFAQSSPYAPAVAPHAMLPVVAPAAAQETPQAVKAAIPPQATPRQAPRPEGQQPPERPWTPTLYEDQPNVRVEVTITYQVGQGAPVKRSAALVIAGSNDSGSLRSGNQVPVPSTTFMPTIAPAATKGDGPSRDTPGGPTPTMNPMMSFQYRSVGLNLDARQVRVAGNRAKMTLGVEFSAVDDKGSDAAKGPGPSYPSFPTFSQNLSVVLESGKPLVIAQTTDVADNVTRKQSVEVVATILK